MELLLDRSSNACCSEKLVHHSSEASGGLKKETEAFAASLGLLSTTCGSIVCVSGLKGQISRQTWRFAGQEMTSCDAW